MSNINIPNKVAGDTFSATEFNEVKTAVNSKLDASDAYVLPVASQTVLGGVKQGDNVTIDSDGVISVADLPVASNSVLGGIKVGSNLSIDGSDFLGTSTNAQTGTAIAFTDDAIYGSTGTPETGNITAVLTSAKLGCVVTLIHNNGSAPTLGTEFKKLSGSGDYVTGQLNYIMFMYIDATHILYSINQEA